MTIFGNQSFDELVASINRNVEQVDETEVQTKEIVDESQQRTEEYRVDTNVFEKDQTQGNSQLGLSSQVQEASKGNSFFGGTSQPEVAKVENSTTTPSNNPFFGTATSTSTTASKTDTKASTTSTTNPFFSTTNSDTTPSKDTSSQEETKNTATVWTPGGTTTSKSKPAKQAKPATTKQPSEEKASTTVTPEQLNHVTADPTSLDAKTIDAIAEAVVDKLQERLSK